MAAKVKLTIDGREVQAKEGMNLIDAAELGGIHIPNLCYLKGLKGIGACRMCLVEIEGMKAPMIACTTRVKEGMAVHTKTKAVEEVRRFVTDLVVSMHPLDCMTCTKAGTCNLQNYAYDFEIKESTFTRKKPGFGIDDANPFIRLDPDYCVLCARCVRICKHQGTNILDFKGRGVGSKVIAGADQPLHETDCTFCGSCIDVCPVNAILEADRWRKGREWDYEKTQTVCLLCGNSCDLVVNARDGMVRKINAGAPDGTSERFICAYGRFGFDSLLADSRVTAPMKRVNGGLVQTTWEDALGLVAAELRKADGSAGFISTAGILNEDALTLRRLAEEVVRTRNHDTTASLYGDRDALLSDSADLETADLIVLVGLDPDQWKRVLPALDAVVRKRVNLGAKLVTISAAEPRIAGVAAVSLVEDEAEALRSLAKALLEKGVGEDKKLAEAVSGAVVSEAIEKAAALMADAKSVVILSIPALYEAAANLSLLKGASVSVPLESNAKGAVLMGLPSEGASFSEMVAGGVKVLYAVGEMPLSQRPPVEFLIVQTAHMTDFAKQADVVLPSTAYLEADGTIVDFLGRLRTVRKSVHATGEARTHREIFREVAKTLGADLKEAKEADTEKLARFKPKGGLSAFVRRDGFGVRADEMIESLNSAVIKGSRLLWLKENAKVPA